MSDFVDDVDFYDEMMNRPHAEVRCARCNERHLYWVGGRGAWRLVDEDGEPHKCKGVGPIKFKNLTEVE